MRDVIQTTDVAGVSGKQYGCARFPESRDASGFPEIRYAKEPAAHVQGVTEHVCGRQ